MEQLTGTPERRTTLAVLGLLAAVIASVAAGPAAGLAAALPLALVAYSSLLADRNALRGPGPLLARVNAELTAANAGLRWQVVQNVDAVVRDASTGGLADVRAPVALASAFLLHHVEPVEAILDEIAPVKPA
jgi:hypothetical protein